MGWLGWLFQQPPAPWQWVGLIVAVLAFVGVVVSVPVLFCGRPKLIIGFGTYDVKDGTCMICQIWNEPITKGILNFLKVHRDPAQDVLAFFAIKERGTNKTIFRTPTTVLIKTQSGVRAERVSLPPSLFPASFIIALVNKDKGQVKLEKGADMLQVGEYKVEAKIENEGKQYTKTGILIVQQEYPFAHWA